MRVKFQLQFHRQRDFMLVDDIKTRKKIKIMFLDIISTIHHTCTITIIKCYFGNTL